MRPGFLDRASREEGYAHAAQAPRLPPASDLRARGAEFFLHVVSAPQAARSALEETMTKRLLAAVASDAEIKIVYTDQPNGAEPLDAVCKALTDIGVQPETVEALAERTLIAKARRRTAALDAIGKLRNPPNITDDLVLDVLDSRTILFEGTEGTVLMKARQAARHPQSSRLTAAGSAEAPAGGWRLGGAVHPALARIVRGYRGEA